METVHEIILKPDLSRFCVCFCIEERNNQATAHEVSLQSPLDAIVAAQSAAGTARYSHLDAGMQRIQAANGTKDTEAAVPIQVGLAWASREEKAHIIDIRGTICSSSFPPQPWIPGNPFDSPVFREFSRLFYRNGNSRQLQIS